MIDNIYVKTLRMEPNYHAMKEKVDLVGIQAAWRGHTLSARATEVMEDTIREELYYG